MFEDLTTLDVLLSYEIILTMQCNFSYTVCQKIFPEDTTHYWDKWNVSSQNMLYFLSRLDRMNKIILIKWGCKLIDSI